VPDPAQVSDRVAGCIGVTAHEDLVEGRIHATMARAPRPGHDQDRRSHRRREPGTGGHLVEDRVGSRADRSGVSTP